jgi:hypothetical protein
MPYRETQLARFKQRIERFQHLLELKAPPTILEQEGGMIIRSVLGIVGGAALAEIADTLVGYDRELMGICKFHDIAGEDRPIVESGLCAECLAEANQVDQEGV